MLQVYTVLVLGQSARHEVAAAVASFIEMSGRFHVCPSVGLSVYLSLCRSRCLSVPLSPRLFAVSCSPSSLSVAATSDCLLLVLQVIKTFFHAYYEPLGKRERQRAKERERNLAWPDFDPDSPAFLPVGCCFCKF